jgi:hypothetical protein
MSKSTLAALKSELKTNFDIALKAENDLKYLDKSICNAMEDRVGQSARDSLAGIRDHFSFNSHEGLKSVEKATVALCHGYSNTDEISAKADAILYRARYTVKELGEV